MRNTLGDLNDYLFEQMERINDDSLSKEELEKELRKADSIVKISEKIIQNADLAFRTMKHLDEYGYRNGDGRDIPPMLETRKRSKECTASIAIRRK